jgi:hypothetical protein
MSKKIYKNVSLFYYLLTLQVVTGLFAAVIALLFVKFAEGELFAFIVGFLPDVSLVTWSIVGIMMLFGQVLGNFFAAIYTFTRSELSGRFAMVIGAAEAIWMAFQYFFLHIHSILVLLFFILAFLQFVLGFLLNERIKEIQKALRDNS